MKGPTAQHKHTSPTPPPHGTSLTELGLQLFKHMGGAKLCEPAFTEVNRHLLKYYIHAAWMVGVNFCCAMDTWTQTTAHLYFGVLDLKE